MLVYFQQVVSLIIIQGSCRNLLTLLLVGEVGMLRGGTGSSTGVTRNRTLFEVSRAADGHKVYGLSAFMRDCLKTATLLLAPGSGRDTRVPKFWGWGRRSSTSLSSGDKWVSNVPFCKRKSKKFQVTLSHYIYKQYSFSKQQ